VAGNRVGHESKEIDMATIGEIVKAKGEIGQIEAVIVGIQMRLATKREGQRWQHRDQERMIQREIRSARLWVLSELGLSAADEVAEMTDEDVMDLYRSQDHGQEGGH
jgi:hypothetical protein